MDILKHLMSLDTLDDLSYWVKAQDQDRLRTVLLKAFDQHIEYKNIAQWARAVRLCEALAITGWGQREALDAVSYSRRYRLRIAATILVGLAVSKKMEIGFLSRSMSGHLFRRNNLRPEPTRCNFQCLEVFRARVQRKGNAPFPFV